jgi:hypothetical protein
MAEQILSLLLYLILILTAFWFISPQKKPRSHPAYHLACLLEDAPESSLKGQFYPLATPLATPIACTVPQVWRSIYRQSLAKPDVNYWQWRGMPENEQFCRELRELLRLNPARGYAKEILESLALGQDPFYHLYWDLKAIANGNFNTIGTNKLAEGRFARRDLRTHQQMRRDFRQWHLQACQQLGKERVKAVYRVCYGSDWSLIAQILYPSPRSLAVMIMESANPVWWRVLGITPFTTTSRIENNYKTLLCYWHPDRNSHPNATEITAHLNRAYDCYQGFQEMSSQDNAPLWTKIRRWIP